MSMRSRFVRHALAISAAGVVAAVAMPGQALAASQFASKNGFDTSKKCDAIVGVSDETTSGKIEVYGGFSCPTGYGLANQPEKATIRVRLFQNGQEVVQSKRSMPDCSGTTSIRKTCSSESHQVTYPDNSGTQTFYGKIEIVSFSGTVTLTTPTISS
ncbi:hypothetical protein ACQPZJ_43735 [Actinoplanes sp. CA-054009]